VHIAAVTGIRTDLYTIEEIQAWAVPKKPESYEESIRSREFFVAEEGEVIVGFGVLNPQSAEASPQPASSTSSASSCRCR
jgi:hypothetical protein